MISRNLAGRYIVYSAAANISDDDFSDVSPQDKNCEEHYSLQ